MKLNEFHEANRRRQHEAFAPAHPLTRFVGACGVDERRRLPTFREAARALRVNVADVELLADDAELEVKSFGDTTPMSDWEIEPPDPEPCCTGVSS